MLVDAQADHITFQMIGAWNLVNQVIDSYTLWTQPQAHIPDAPKGLTESAVASDTVKLSWTDMSSNESGFKIEKSLDGTVFLPATTTGRNAMRGSVTGLLPGL